MLNLEAYCDASFDTINKQSTATTIIVSDMKFHGFKVGEFNGTETGAQAELLGIIQTMEMVRNMEDVGEVHIYCDSEATILLYKRCLRSKSIAPAKQYTKDWKRLMDLSRGYKIIPENITGHQDIDNPNKLCDLIARNTLRIIKD